MLCSLAKRYFLRRQPKHVQEAERQTRLKNYLGHKSGNARVADTYQQKEMSVMLKKEALCLFLCNEMISMQSFMKGNQLRRLL